MGTQRKLDRYQRVRKWREIELVDTKVTETEINRRE